MMRVALVAFLFCLAGCSHTSVQGGWGGGGSSGGNVSVGVGGGSVAWVLIGIGLIAAGEYSDRRHVEGLPRMNEPPQELDGARRVNEQDCTQPIKDWSANLKCK